MKVDEKLRYLKRHVFARETLQKTFAPKRLPSIAAICASLGGACIGFTAIAKDYHLSPSFYGYYFLVLALLFLMEEVRLFLGNRKKSVRLLVFVVALFTLASSATALPMWMSLRDYGFTASLSNYFVLALALTVFGIAGTALAMAAHIDFRPIGNQRAAYLFLSVCILLIIYPLVIIIGEVVTNGAPGLSWDFLTQDIDVLNFGAGGGISAAIVGTFMLILLIGVIGVPLGVCAAIYLVEYAGDTLIVRFIQTAITILRGIPSIVFGLFAFVVFAPIFGRNYITGGLILAVYSLPMIIRASSEALKAIPNLLREGSLALGATKWQTIRKVVLPPASPGIITGTVLGVGEAAGETAPLLFFTTFGLGHTPRFSDMIVSLQNHIYNVFQFLGFGGAEVKAARVQNLWSTALMFLIIILSMNIIALIIREKYREEF
jgi:phosphate transport system permease protein